jgi:hypothetical protein
MDSGFICFSGIHLFESSEQGILRSKFIPLMVIGAVPVAEIEFDVFNWHELVPIFMALQHLYVNLPQVLEEICTLIKADITR